MPEEAGDGGRGSGVRTILQGARSVHRNPAARVCGQPASGTVHAREAAPHAAAKPASSDPERGTEGWVGGPDPRPPTPDPGVGGGRVRVGVLLSGRGSNFVALADACARGEVPAEIVLVVSNRADARGLERAAERGIPARVIPSKGRPREEQELEVIAALAEAGAEWVCLAGYMRLLSSEFVDRFPQRMLNIHPALLPAFPGLEAQRQAWEHGVKVSGCTVHLIDAGLDSGPIVVQRTVPVLDDDTADTLAHRILEQEHIAYPQALRMLLTRPWRIDGRRVVFD
jgi:phosphoribosylglycinamide formyltransferase-1